MKKFQWFIIRILFSGNRTMDKIGITWLSAKDGSEAMDELKLRVSRLELGAVYNENDGLLRSYVGTKKDGASFIKAGKDKLLYIPSQAQKDTSRKLDFDIGHKAEKQVFQ